MTETLQEVEQQYQKGTVILEAVNHIQTIIGSIRGRLENDTGYVSKLSIHPASQNQGEVLSYYTTWSFIPQL